MTRALFDHFYESSSTPVQLENNLLEPQLKSLVNYNEQMLVVMVQAFSYK